MSDILESDLARELGLKKDEIRDLRKKHLAAGDFSFSKSGITILEAAANRIRAAFGAAKKEGGELPLIASTPPPSEKKGGPEMASREPVTLWVKRCPLNIHIVECCLNKELAGDVVRVRVRSSANFIPKMEIRALHESGTLYSLVGRCPRYRGRF
ncbi:MAG: hypothetical protein ACFUZC_04875 [Chthoniobacteraceae bacterium]